MHKGLASENPLILNVLNQRLLAKLPWLLHYLSLLITDLLLFYLRVAVTNSKFGLFTVLYCLPSDIPYAFSVEGSIFT